MDEMRFFQEEWIKEKEATGDLWFGGNREFVFHSGFGRPYYPQKATNEWITFREKYGFEGLRLHDMCHTMVALLIEEGVNLKTIQKGAGHASFRTTSDTYGHVSKKTSDASANNFNKFNPNLFVNKSSTRDF